MHYESQLDTCSSLSGYSDSDCESDATVIYDSKSYNLSSRIFEDETDPFCQQVSDMNHKIKLEHGDEHGLRQLLSSDLSDLVDDFDLDSALKKCREEGDWKDKSFAGNKFSLKNRPLNFSNSTRTKTLKSALNSVENRKLETVYKLNEQFKMVKQLQLNFLKQSRNNRETFRVK